MRQKRFVGLYLSVAIILLALISVGAKKAVESYAAQNKVNPLQYHPLALGNSWTYIWENKKGVYNDPKIYSTIYSLNFFFSKANIVISNNDYDLYGPVTVRETYTIVQHVENKFKQHLYFFAISCAGDSCKDHRFGDGRFYYADNLFWFWELSDTSPKAILLFNETILSKRYENYVPGPDYPRDTSQMMRFTSNYLKWDYSNKTEYINMFLTIEMDYSDHSVTVPAGKFDHCILSKEIYTWSAKKFIIYRFFAPGVGKVKEYQELEDGTITYVMSLEKYNLAK